MPRLTINYGLRYDTTSAFSWLPATTSGRNPALAGNGIISGIPHDIERLLRRGLRGLQP